MQTSYRWVPVLLRLIVGYDFIAHGYSKVSRGPELFAVALKALELPMPLLLAWRTTVVELVGGFAVLVGAFMPIAILPMAIVLLTALFTVHLPYGFLSVKLLEITSSGARFGSVGYETDLLYLADLGALLLAGAGPLSYDHWRRRVRTE